MNVKGERIIIFGDSISHNGPDRGPDVVDITQGSDRVSGQPGDLLASLLLEQGAQAARVNARVSRSALSFFNGEDAQGMFAADAAFAPTKVIVVLGTNDLGFDMAKDSQAMQAIKDAYEGMGAEVWAIGPFTYNQEHLNALAPSVVEMMQSVFGRRFIDGRPLSVQEGRAGDGVHFGAQSAALTAHNMLAAISSASSFPWKWLAVGAGAAFVGALLFSRFKKPVGFAGLDEYCSPQLAPSAFNRCVARQKRMALGEANPDWSSVTNALKAKQFKKAARAWKAIHKKHGFVEAPANVKRELDQLESHERLAYDAMTVGLGARSINDKRKLSPNEAIDEFDRLLKDPDPAAMIIAQDVAMENGIKLSDWRAHGAPRGTFELVPSSDALDTSAGWHVPQKVTDVGIKVKKRHGRWQPVLPSGEIARSATINTDGKGYDLRQNAEDAVTALRVMPADEKATRAAELHAGFRRTRFNTRIPNQVFHGVLLTESDMPNLRRTYINTTWAEARKRAARDAWVIAKALKQLPEDATKDQVKAAIIAVLPEAENEPSELFGARRRPAFETKTTDDGPGMSPPSQGKLQIGRKNDSYKDLPWSKVVAEAKKEKKAVEAGTTEGYNNLRLTMNVKHSTDLHTPFSHVDWDPFDTKGAIKFAQKLVDDKGAMYSSVEAHADRPHDRSDRNPAKGHWTIASFKDDSLPE